MNLPPGHIPAWVDKARLCIEVSMHEDTVDALIREGKLPPGKKIRGKYLWRWADVDKWLDQGGPTPQNSPSADAERIRDATRRLSQRASR
jgi:hypothetical protein